MLTLSSFSRPKTLPLRIDVSWIKLRPLAQKTAAVAAVAASFIEPKPAAQLKPAPVIVTPPGEDATRYAGLITQILDLNPSASVEFLSRFSADDLDVYLEHLYAASQPRGRMARWVHPAMRTPAPATTPAA